MAFYPDLNQAWKLDIAFRGPARELTTPGDLEKLYLFLHLKLTFRGDENNIIKVGVVMIQAPDSMRKVLELCYARSVKSTRRPSI
jgi:hypothetical protein